jgi:hypothetical protein
LPAAAAIWPEQLYDHKRTKVEPIVVSDKPVWEEYGLEAAERATYTGATGFTASAYRLKDSTSALAVSQWLSKPALQIGNYVLFFDGNFQLPKQLQDYLTIQLPRLDQAALPTLPDFLPKANLVPNSRRFVVGPTSLNHFEPRISPSVAAFSLGAEAQLAKYSSPAGELNLSIFSYPTPQIARERAAEFQKLAGAIVKRSGPLVAVTLTPPSADEAEKLLGKVNYQANLTWSENVNKPPEGNVGDLILGAVKLIGALVGFTILAGLGYAGFRIVMRKWGVTHDEEMVTLHLQE